MNTWANLLDMFYSQASRLEEKPFIWSKEGDLYVSKSWGEVAREVTSLAQGLRSLGINPGDRVFLCSESRPEWLISNLAVIASGGITVPAYTTNTISDHLHILNDSGAKAAIVSTSLLADRVIAAVSQTEHVKFLITIENLNSNQSSSLDIKNWQAIVDEGKDLDANIDTWVSAVNADDTAVIIYTSGTGGVPKGVMLAHKSILHNCSGARNLLSSFGLENEVFLSFLPLPHSYEYTGGQFFPISIGAEVYFAEGIEHLARNMKEARPTLMTAVPRLYESMHARITRGVERSGGLKAKLFEIALQLGRKKIEHPGSLSLGEKILDGLVERLVRNKVRDNFGGRLKALVSGGAPLNLDIGLFFSALGLRLLQGYGQTEAAPVISANPPERIKLHTVGPPLLNTEVKIADDGEILVRGDLVMKGYWRNEDATNEAIQDGWLCTGDVGVIDEDGYIEITDRKKEIIVNSGGDNISPQRVEGFLTLEPEIGQAVVCGDKKPHLIALIVPDADFAGEWAASNKKSTNFTHLVEDEEFIKALSQAVERVNNNLGAIERVNKFMLTADPFTVENEQMTPTLKVRRHVINKIYGDQLEALYR